jgi:hypothetical protein
MGLLLGYFCFLTIVKGFETNWFAEGMNLSIDLYYISLDDFEYLYVSIFLSY